MTHTIGELLIDAAPIAWGLKTIVFLGLALTLLTQINRTKMGIWLTRMFVAIAVTSATMTLQTAYIASRRSADDIDTGLGWVITVGTVLFPVMVAIAGTMTLLWQDRLHRERDGI